MYVYGPESQQDLGFDPISAVLTGSALKEVFGIGAKKREHEQLQQQFTGYWTDQFPPNTDWKEYLSRPRKGVIQGKQTSLQAQYDWQAGRRDSWLVKNKVASAEDLAAFIAMREMKNPKLGCDPNAKPGTPGYFHCPKYSDSKTNIFDTKAREAWLAKQQRPKSQPRIKRKKAPSPIQTRKAPPTQKQPSAAPPVATSLAQPSGGGTFQQIIDAITKQLPQNQFPQAPQPSYPPTPVQVPVQESELPEWALPVAIGAGVLLIGVAMQGRGKRKRR